MNKLIGIFGGAFDPIHLGHLRAAIEVTEKFGLQSLHFVPCQRPVHKVPTIASPLDRLAMLELAVDGMKNFQVDRREVDRESPSYMIETLQSFRLQYGKKMPLALILGWDALIHFTTWRDWEAIFSLAHLIIVSRGQKTSLSKDLDAQLAVRSSKDAQTMTATPAGSVFYQRITRLDITSTKLRRLIANQRSARYLVPDGVWVYIQERGLYTSGE